jgi:hypothetical protein
VVRPGTGNLKPWLPNWLSRSLVRRAGNTVRHQRATYASSPLTFVWCASMSAMGGIPMPGGRTTLTMDAGVRSDVPRRHGVVPRHVGRDDATDDRAARLWSPTATTVMAR